MILRNPLSEEDLLTRPWSSLSRSQKRQRVRLEKDKRSEKQTEGWQRQETRYREAQLRTLFEKDRSYNHIALVSIDQCPWWEFTERTNAFFREVEAVLSVKIVFGWKAETKHRRHKHSHDWFSLRDKSNYEKRIALTETMRVVINEIAKRNGFKDINLRSTNCTVINDPAAMARYIFNTNKPFRAAGWPTRKRITQGNITTATGWMPLRNKNGRFNHNLREMVYHCIVDRGQWMLSKGAKLKLLGKHWWNEDDPIKTSGRGPWFKAWLELCSIRQ